MLLELHASFLVKSQAKVTNRELENNKFLEKSVGTERLILTLEGGKRSMKDDKNHPKSTRIL